MKRYYDLRGHILGVRYDRYQGSRRMSTDYQLQLPKFLSVTGKEVSWAEHPWAAQETAIKTVKRILHGAY